jgi:NADH:ubiquinone oxidoreductase subunit H
VNIAFITLLERKILGYSQRRLGPNKPSFIGLLQPIRDAVKLFVKNFFSPKKRHRLIF